MDCVIGLDTIVRRPENGTLLVGQYHHSRGTELDQPPGHISKPTRIRDHGHGRAVQITDFGEPKRQGRVEFVPQRPDQNLNRRGLYPRLLCCRHMSPLAPLYHAVNASTGLATAATVTGLARFAAELEPVGKQIFGAQWRVVNDLKFGE